MKEKEPLKYKWYILTIKGGKSEKIISHIKWEIIKKDEEWMNYIKELKSVPKKLQNYIFCYCFLTHELVNFFYKTPYVKGFLNYEKTSNELPEPASQNSVETLFLLLKESKEEEPQTNKFLNSAVEVGDLVKITSGIFSGTEGRVIYFNKEKGRITIDTHFFDRNVNINLLAKENLIILQKKEV